MLESTPFDVIVSDMRMPGMDGAALLEKVRQLHPEVVRIVFSGHTELEATLRAVPVAHQFLLKPCDADMLRVAIERACSLQSILTSEALSHMVGSLGDLPSAPRVYAALTQALSDPEVPLARIAQIVEQDVAISAKVLQLVNSAFFGLARSVNSVRDAVSYLGVNILQSLVVKVEAFRIFVPSEHVEGFSIDEFDAHAELTAMLARMLKLPKHLSDPAVVGALLHDVGKLVLATRVPKRFSEAIRAAGEREVPLHRMEMELFGVTHAEIGAYLLGLWGFSTFVTEAVAHHHHPGRVPHDGFDAVAAVYVANLLAHRAHQPPGALLSEPVDEDLLRSLGVAGQVPLWNKNARDAALESEETSDAVR
jgi:HD-like signal output (HDOD) protein